jgi:hypothetical protein
MNDAGAITKIRIRNLPFPIKEDLCHNKTGQEVRVSDIPYVQSIISSEGSGRLPAWHLLFGRMSDRVMSESLMEEAKNLASISCCYAVILLFSLQLLLSEAVSVRYREHCQSNNNLLFRELTEDQDHNQHSLLYFVSRQLPC